AGDSRRTGYLLSQLADGNPIHQSSLAPHRRTFDGKCVYKLAEVGYEFGEQLVALGATIGQVPGNAIAHFDRQIVQRELVESRLAFAAGNRVRISHCGSPSRRNGDVPSPCEFVL